MSREVKLSATRINMFLECKLKYWFNYHDRLPKMSNPSFKLGLSCHETLEFAGKIWMDKESFDDDDRKEIMSVYDEVSIKQGLADYSLHMLGKELVEKKLDDFKSSTGKKIISLEGLFGTNADNEIHTSEGVPLIGAMDMVSEIDRDTLMVVDYKTSNTRPTTDQMKNDMQLSIYNLVAGIKWPQYKRIILRLDFLKSEPMDTYRTPEETAEFSDYITKLHEEMVNFKKHDAAPSLNIFCSWCDFKGYCGRYKKACEKTNYCFESAEVYRDPDLMNEWLRVRNTKKVLEGRERELGMLIMERIKRKNININNGESELYIRNNSRVQYDVKTVFEHVPKRNLLKMVNLNKMQVDKYISNRPRIRDIINEKSTHNYTRPFLSTKKIKKKKKDKGGN